MQLRQDKNDGLTYKILSKKFEISESTVFQIVSGKTWKHVVKS